MSQRVQLFAAQRLTELIESNRRHLEVAFNDPDGIWDHEPARITAHVALAKLQAVLIKELGSLYQVSKPPVRADEQEQLVPVAEVERLLAEAAQRQDEVVASAVAAAVVAVRLEVESRQRLELESARARVVESLAVLRGDQG